MTTARAAATARLCGSWSRRGCRRSGSCRLASPTGPTASPTPTSALAPASPSGPDHGRLRVGWAAFGDRVLVGAADVTSDPAALDSTGTWVVVQTFEGELTCVRMTEQRAARGWYDAAPRWTMPAAHEWS